MWLGGEFGIFRKSEVLVRRRRSEKNSRHLLPCIDEEINRDVVKREENPRVYRVPFLESCGYTQLEAWYLLIAA